MANNSSFKKYEVNQLPNNPSQIVPGSVVDGATTINYLQCGGLYFNFTIGNHMIGSGNSYTAADSYSRLITLLGIAVPTVYANNVSLAAGNGNDVGFDTGSGTWQQQLTLGNIQIIVAILSS